MFKSYSKKQAGVVYAANKRGEIKASDKLISTMYDFADYSANFPNPTDADACDCIRAAVDAIFAHDYAEAQRMVDAAARRWEVEIVETVEAVETVEQEAEETTEETTEEAMTETETTRTVYTVTDGFGEYRQYGDNIELVINNAGGEDFEDKEEAIAEYNKLAQRDVMRARWSCEYECGGCIRKGLAYQVELFEYIEEFDGYDWNVIETNVLYTETYDRDDYYADVDTDEEE